jgi:hypothetical protein
MPVMVVSDYPERHIARRIGSKLVRFVGGLLVLAGLLASIVAIPTTFVVLGVIVGTDFQGMPVDAAVRAWAISAPIAIVASIAGMRRLRGGRAVILFLRRFGYGEATRVATFAAAGAIGGSWRLITLDDAAITPMGVSTGTRRLFLAGGAVSGTLRGLGKLLFRVFSFAVGAMWVITGADYLLNGEYLTCLGVVGAWAEMRLPIEQIGTDLPGLCATAGTVAGVSFVGVGALLIAGMLAFPLAAPLLFVGATADALKEAETNKWEEIRSLADVAPTANEITKRARKVLAPRLVVIQVASEVWQETVRGLSNIASVVLIDVSEPTENVLWELEELIPRFGARCVLTCHQDRIGRLQTGAAERTTGSIDERLARLLDGREVLAYEADRNGMKRFARSLQAKLITVAS